MAVPSRDNRRLKRPNLQLNRRAAPGRTELTAALGELLKAHDYAVDAACEIWNFAVEIEILRQLGITDTDLRWLISKNYLEHRRDDTGANDSVRRFRTAHPLKFQAQSCFVLTAAGVSFANQFFDGSCAVPGVSPIQFQGHLLREWWKPCWDDSRRQLRVCQYIVKHFRWPAPNQEKVLAAFQDEDWSNRIDDPLPPVEGTSPKERLHDTIKCLNRRQRIALLHFGGDGTSEGVVWQFTAKARELLRLERSSHPATQECD
jgi:hypothetical protein